MPQWIESLEGRTLFAVAIEPFLATEYSTVLVDNAALKHDSAVLIAAVKSQTAVTTADLKAQGVSKTNTALLKQLKSASNTFDAYVKSGSGKYLAKAGVLRRVELAENAYDQKFTTANANKQAAARAAAYKVLTLLQAWEEECSSPGISGITSQVAAIETANPTATKLNIDLQASQAALQTQFNTVDSDLVRTDIAAGVLVGDEQPY